MPKPSVYLNQVKNIGGKFYFFHNRKAHPSQMKGSREPFPRTKTEQTEKDITNELWQNKHKMPQGKHVNLVATGMV